MYTGHCTDLIPKVPYTLVYLSVHIEYTGLFYLLIQAISCSARVSIPSDMTSKQVPEHKIISVVIFLPCFDVKWIATLANLKQKFTHNGVETTNF